MSSSTQPSQTSFTLQSPHGDRPFLADVTYLPDHRPKPVVLFHHGFKGFKDWGPFNDVARHFASEGFVFIKMNFSRNGTTPEQPTDFADLAAFAENNLSIELDDGGFLINQLFARKLPIPEGDCDLDRFYLLGHSRGGSHAILKAGEEPRVRKLVTWAAVPDLRKWIEKDDLDRWKREGVIYIANSRTNQQMPMNYQIVEDFMKHRERLDIPRVLPLLDIPVMAIHGSQDATVPVGAAHQLSKLNKSVRVEVIEGADHTFGATHPPAAGDLPGHLRRAIQLSVDFFKAV